MCDSYKRQGRSLKKTYAYGVLTKWVDAVDAAVFQLYKTVGTQRIQYLCNEMYKMEKYQVTNNDAEIDEYNALIDIHVNQIERIERCQKQNYENIGCDGYDGRDGIYGLSVLFHQHSICKSKTAFVRFLYSYNEVYNVDISKYVDIYGKINTAPEGFDFIYENVFMNNPLFIKGASVQTTHIKNELVLLKAPLIIQMCKIYK